jgi:hypothetical protein
MSSYPRRVTSPVQVSWGEPGCSIWVRAGSAVDVPPGSALEAAYGASNLEPLPPGDPAKADKSAISN